MSLLNKKDTITACIPISSWMKNRPALSTNESICPVAEHLHGVFYYISIIKESEEEYK